MDQITTADINSNTYFFLSDFNDTLIGWSKDGATGDNGLENNVIDGGKGDDGKPKQMPWEDWRPGDEVMTSGWMRATAPAGNAAYEEIGRAHV